MAPTRTGNAYADRQIASAGRNRATSRMTYRARANFEKAPAGWSSGERRYMYRRGENISKHRCTMEMVVFECILKRRDATKFVFCTLLRGNVRKLENFEKLFIFSSPEFSSKICGIYTKIVGIFSGTSNTKVEC